MGDKITKSDREWREQLGEEAFRVCRRRGTEAPFSGALLDNKEAGIYACAGCGAPLFSADSKYDSGSGWPSFFQPVDDDCITERQDTSHGMTRTEVLCSRCDSHLGHAFPDGPKPTGVRYCTNSVSLNFIGAGSGDNEREDI